MRTLILLFVASSAFSPALGGLPELTKDPCAELYGMVAYEDVTDQGRRVARQETYKFRSWSTEEQFDEILVRQSSQIPDAKGLQARVTFYEHTGVSAAEKAKEFLRIASASTWTIDQKFFILGDLKMKHLVRHEAPTASRFKIALEKDGKGICERSFSIIRGD